MTASNLWPVNQRSRYDRHRPVPLTLSEYIKENPNLDIYLLQSLTHTCRNNNLSLSITRGMKQGWRIFTIIYNPKSKKGYCRLTRSWPSLSTLKVDDVMSSPLGPVWAVPWRTSSTHPLTSWVNLSLNKIQFFSLFFERKKTQLFHSYVPKLIRRV